MKRFLLFLLLVHGNAEARDIVLFGADGSPVPNYNELVKFEHLRPGDHFVFADGAKFEFLRPLGKGGASTIVAVRPLPPATDHGESALRLRLHAGSIKTNSGHLLPTSSFMRQTIEGYDLLKKEGVAVAEIKRHFKEEYILSDLVLYDFSGDKFLHDPLTIDPAMRKKAENALVEFAGSVGRFEAIGDFKPQQLVYSAQQDKWILLDWTADHQLRSPYARSRFTPFDPGSRFAKLTHTWRVNKENGGLEKMALTKWQKNLLNRLDAKAREVGTQHSFWTCRNLFGALRDAVGP